MERVIAPPVVRFGLKAMAGGLSVTLLLAIGMMWSIARLSSTAAVQMKHVRVQERQITLLERLRWNAESIVAIGKGYLVTEEPALRARLDRARTEMRVTVEALTRGAENDQESRIIAELQRVAIRFDHAHEHLIAATRERVPAAELLIRFEREVLPIKGELGGTLDELVDEKESALAAMYRQSEQARDELTSWMYGLLSVLFLVASAITSFFAHDLSRAYCSEHIARESARKAAAAREELLGIVAHDLRNPLNAISMKSALLRRIATLPAAKEQAEGIANIATRMDHLIRGMLDVATIEAGRFSVNVEPCDVDEILDAIREVFAPLTSAKHVVLCCMSKSGLRIEADRNRILQVLSNIVGNALKFAPPCSAIDIDVREEHGYLRFAITDHGPGIPLEQQPRIFERFWRPSAATHIQGTGLGLFIAKAIVEAHHGKIWVETPEQGGATVLFTVPVSTPSAASASLETRSSLAEAHDSGALQVVRC